MFGEKPPAAFLQFIAQWRRKMRKRFLTILGVLLVAVSAIQIETTAARSVRKVARADHHATQQLRDAFGSARWPLTAQTEYANRSERHGLSQSTAVESKSCDVVWCYEN